MPKFDYAKAKKDGYTDEQINGFLASRHGFDTQKALKDGHSLESINQFLSTRQPKKTEEPANLTRGAQAYGIGAAGGAAGLIPDIAQFSPLTYAFQQMGIKTTPQQVEALREEFGTGETKNAFERIMQQSGEFGGQEALVGTALGGPAGGGVGLAHGSVSGAFYGSLKEMGVPDTAALLATALLTVSPIAGQKFIKTLQEGKSAKEALKKAESSIQPPPPPAAASPKEAPASPILKFEGQEIPAGSSSQELAEEALEHLQKPKISAEVLERPLSPKEKTASTEIGESISPEGFYNETHGGRFFEGTLKKVYKKTKEKVSKLYKAAERSYSGINDVMPNVARTTENSIERLKLSGTPTGAEATVLKKLEDLQKMIGDSNALIEVDLARMVKTADSLSDLVKYEVEGAGVKNFLKEIVGAINAEVKSVLSRRGISTKAIEAADAAYGKMANIFFSDEIEPFLRKTTRNPEAIFTEATSNPASYRAIKEALGKTNPKAVDRLERAIVENRVRPYVGKNNLQKIGTEEFSKDMANLEGVIGKKANSVKRQLENHKLRHQSAAEYVDKTPSQVRKMMDSPEGIRALKKELPKQMFDRMAEDKTLQILRGGVVSPEKIRGRQVFDNIRKEHNYDVLKEIYGKEAIDAALVDASKAHKQRMTIEKFVHLGKIAGTLAGAGKLIKVMGVFL